MLPDQSLTDYAATRLASIFYEPTGIVRQIGEQEYVELSGETGAIWVTTYGGNVYSVFIYAGSDDGQLETIMDIIARSAFTPEGPVFIPPDAIGLGASPEMSAPASSLSVPSSTVSLPAMKLPWKAGAQQFTGGPHGGASNWSCSDLRDTSIISGLDFGMSVGTEVLAAAGGRIVYAADAGGAIGKAVGIDHGGSFSTRYWHLSSIDSSITLGIDVSQGRVLGKSGYPRAPHLHLEFRNWSANTPYSAHGVSIDGYTARAFIRTSDGKAFNYQGTLTRGHETQSTTSYCNTTIQRWSGSDGTVVATTGGGASITSTNSETAPPSQGSVMFYEHINRGGKSIGYNSAGWYDLPSDWKASSLKLDQDWGVILYSGYRSGSCITFDHSVDNFTSHYFSDWATNVNDNVRSAYAFFAQCVATCSNLGFNAATAGTAAPVSLMGVCGGAPRCPGPNLRNPGGGYISVSRTITFNWDQVSCSHSGFTFRVKTVSNMDSGGETVVDTGEGGTSRTVTFDSHWDNKDLYWSVRAANAASGADWTPARQFRISPNAPPAISFNSANGSAASQITTRDRNWTFAGTASDPEGLLDRIEFRCSGDNCGSQASHTNGTSWSHTQNDMAGQNDVYFAAYDGIGQATASRHLDLRIDLASPTTTLSLNNDANSGNWPTWFTVPVQARLDAGDNATGRARSGVREIHYRLDGGAWQVQAGSTAALAISSDGTHTVDYYAVDNVGNQEANRSATFRIDRTPPSAPSGVVETSGVPNDQWQKTQNIPAFTWAASSDATSGVWGYQFYFGPDPAGVSYQTFLAADPRQWTPQPGGVRTGIYYLRGRARDIAGNWTAWMTLFTYRYDGTPPENPTGITHATGIANDTWQRTSNLADFAWPVPHDEGSGIKGYNVYWGALQDGTSADFITANAYQSPTPVCGDDEACVGYLRLRSMDNVDTPASDWTTGFVLRYDNAPPVADFTFREGITTTQTLVHLQMAATDQGSGLREMRLSGDGQSWAPWEVYATDRLWLIPAVSRQWWPVYLQVRDGVGLESEVISRTVYLDVNAQQPRSANFRLFDHAMSAGAGEHTSAAYNGRSTVGQVVDSARANSLNYALVGGYQAGSQAIPIVEPGHDEFTFVNGIFASGTGASTLTSLTYRMAGTVGEFGLPNNETTLVSQNHQHQPGFLAAVRPVGSPTPTPIPGPTPTPPPTPACASPSIKVDGDAPFTYNLNVTLGLCAPWATEMLISNNMDFTGATWEPYADSKAWTLTAAGQNVQPCFVYAAFKDVQGTIYTNYFDDIIYDPNPPTGSLATDENTIPGTAQASSDRVTASGPGAAKSITRIGQTVLAQPVALLAPRSDGAVDLYITAQDDNSGLSEMQIGASAAFTDTVWEPYSALKPWTPEGGDGIKTAYARFRDSAGNISAAADVSFALDTLPPLGGLALGRRVVGPDVITTTVYFGAEDNLSGVSDMRMSEDSAFTDAAWQPYTVTLTWPISLTGVTEGALYAQYRDLAGNISEVYSDTYTVDTAPPIVYAEVAPGETLTRTVNVYAYDELADLGFMRLTNDPLMVEDVITVPYTPTITWTFDDRRVVWVQLSDSVGNWAEPYPAYAAPVLAPQAPVATITMMDGPTLTWTHLEANSYYQVWRDTAPYFDPAAPTADTIKLDDVYPPLGGTVTYTDQTADPNLTYYYAVVGVNALGQTSGPSNYVGVFRFNLTPGQ